MRIFRYCLPALTVFSLPCLGALPPLYQTQAEMKRILETDDLGLYLPSGEPIIAIRKTEQGYEIVTTRHTLEADVIYLPNAKPGPARFRIEFKEAHLRANHSETDK